MAKLQTKKAKLPKDKLPKKDEVFTIETSEGDISLRCMRLGISHMRKALEKGEAELTLDMVDEHILDESRETLEKLDVEELFEVVEVWQEASGVDLGESKAS